MATSENHSPEEGIDPYRIFFPLGMFAGFLALVIWLFFLYRWIAFYPRLVHGNLFFFGFFWSFVAGFLMTAIPKMTGTKSASYLELFLGALFVFCQIGISLRNVEWLAVTLFFLQQILLIQFLIRRFFVFRRMPFPGIVFLPIGFLQSLLGIFLFFRTNERDLFLLFAGEAFLVNLIFGLGSKMIPVISRIPGSLTPAESGQKESFVLPFVTAALVNIGYLAELTNAPMLPLGIRLVGFVLAAIFLLRLFSAPTRWTAVGIGLKVSVVLFLFGQVGIALLPDYRLSILHLSYVGGLFLVTVMVSVRVILAHGSQPLSYEVSSPRILSIVGFVVVATILRLFAQVELSNPFLLSSIVFMIASMVLWAHKFYSCLTGQEDAEQC